MQAFKAFPLSPGTQDAVASMGWDEPTPVQQQSIPPLLEGRDLMAQARTGTGKTGAFGVPLVERAARSGQGVVALVLVPTRELALQVAEQLTLLARGTPARVAAVYGGVGFQPQVQALRARGPILLVATPGRLLDHLQQRTADLRGVRVLILDEADRMLDMGFLPDVERVLRALPAQRQTALFSATLPEPIRKLSQRFLRDPLEVRVEQGPVATPDAEQFKLTVGKEQKAGALLALLDLEGPERALVFTRTKHLARRLAGNLAKAGWDAVALQGNMSQGQRERAMAAFREGKAQILVATDIASRGLDVPEVSHVINYDIPNDPDAYVHRIGRTARMGRAGRAFTFVQPDQGTELRDVERHAGAPLQPFALEGFAAPAPVASQPRALHSAPQQGRGPGRGQGARQRAKARGQRPPQRHHPGPRRQEPERRDPQRGRPAWW